jgi:hypothetical protein
MQNARIEHRKKNSRNYSRMSNYSIEMNVDFSIFQLRIPRLLIACGMFAVSVSFADSSVVPDALPSSAVPTISTKSAADAWAGLVESSLLGTDAELPVSGAVGKFTFGAEKEGSSSMITRVMSPPPEVIKNMVNQMSEPNQRSYLLDFIKNYANGRYRNSPVDKTGRPIDVPQLEGVSDAQLNAMSTSELLRVHQEWLDKSGLAPFSFLRPQVRQKIFDGTLPGLNSAYSKRLLLGENYRLWKPLYGKPELYVTNAHPTSVGWEINFVPQPTYAQDGKMIDWFRYELRNGGQLFEAPGHQRMVFPQRTGTEKTDMEKLAETYRALQSYVWLRSQEGLSGAEGARYKDLTYDAKAMDHEVGFRHVIRKESNRFGANTLAVELRAGTKTDETR